MHSVKEIHYESQVENAEMTCFAFLPDGGMVAGDSEGNLQIFQCEGGAHSVIPAHDGPLRAVAVAHGRIFSAGEDQCVVVRRIDAAAEVAATVPSDAVVSGIFALGQNVVCWDEAGGLTYIGGDKVLSTKESNIPAAQTWGSLSAASDSAHVVLWDSHQFVIAGENPDAPLQTVQLSEAIRGGEDAAVQTGSIRSCHLGRDGLVVACEEKVYTCAWDQPLSCIEIGQIANKGDRDSYIQTLLARTPGFTGAMEAACHDALTSATRDTLSHAVSSNGCFRNIPAPWGYSTFDLVLPSGIEVKDDSGKPVFYGGLSQWDASLDGFFPLAVEGAALVWGWKTIRAVSQALSVGEGREAAPFWEHEMADYCDPTAVLVEGDRVLVCGYERALEVGLADLCKAASRHTGYVETVDTSGPLLAWRMEDPTRCLVPLQTGRLLLVSAARIEELPFKGLYWRGGFCASGSVILKWHGEQLLLLDLESPEDLNTPLLLKLPAVSNQKTDSELLHWAGVFANGKGDGFVAIQKSGAVFSISKSGNVTLENILADVVTGARGTPDGLLVLLSSGEHWRVSRDGQSLQKAEAAPAGGNRPQDQSDSVSIADWRLGCSGDRDSDDGVALFKGDDIVWRVETKNWAFPLALLASGHAVIKEGKTMKIMEPAIPAGGFDLPRLRDPRRKSASFGLQFGSFKQIDGIA